MLKHLLSAIDVGKKRYGNYAELSRRSGVSEANISRWRKGTQTPRLSDYAHILNAVNATIVFPDEKLEPYEFIQCGRPYLEDGKLKIEKMSQSPIALAHDWMRNVIHPGINGGNAVMIDVSDDSMSPEFHKHDIVLLDTTDTNIEPGNVYLMSDCHGALKFRKIKSESTGEWTLLCSNPEWSWANETIKDLEQLTVHGRVRWASRRFA